MLGVWAGCAAPGPGFDLASFNSSTDQQVIARYYQEEAFRLMQQAEDADARAGMYERRFGPGSDWVSGARLLAQSYRLAAEDRERLAKEHLDAGRDARSSTASSLRPQASERRIP